MSPTVVRKPLVTPERRIALFYLTQMMPLGTAVVHAGIWFASKGVDSGGIGIINSLPVLIMVAINLSIGRIADRAKDWRSVIVVGASVQAAATLGLFFANEFWGILAVWTLAIIPNTAISPVADAATMRLTARNGTSFGPIRACSTLGYTGSVIVTGALVTAFGGQIFVPIYVGFSLLKALAAFALPKFRAPERAQSTAAPSLTAGRLIEVMQPWFLLPLIGYAMAFGTHLILNAFAALVWKDQGLSDQLISLLIFIGACAEASMMLVWKWTGARMDPRYALLTAGLVAVFRWAMMGFSPPLPLLIALQLLHAITFAMGYLGCVHFVARHTSEGIAAEAQSFYAVLQQAMSVIAVLGFGWITSYLGAHAFWVAAAFALLGSALIWTGIRYPAGTATRIQPSGGSA